MRIREANGLSVWLTVDGEKLDEQTDRKTGDEETGIRMECFVCPKRNQEFTINAHLGRQKPWKKDWIAEPIHNGNSIHSLHIRKRWHVTHKMSTYYEEDEGGSLVETNLSFGDIVDPSVEEGEAEEGDDSDDTRDGTLVVDISRGEIERVKPTKRRISQRIREKESTSGTRRKAEEKTAFGEEFVYDETDREEPFLKFVFKVRSQAYLKRHKLLDKIPAQQHPSQVSRTVRLKAEPDAVPDEQIIPSSSFTSARQAYHPSYNRASKRELSVDESVIMETPEAKRLRLAEEKIKTLEDLIQQSRRR
ncbi:uncharacterized protein L201_002769 [Kwoniella dendrophila CBS 6074]|uniref:DUF7918 domain-containing protein n=1 Tax=Kwoniella dendrophila CBS 6074 TaxID=1295534 RepID=A0AAX4JR06_9TREE